MIDINILTETKYLLDIPRYDWFYDKQHQDADRGGATRPLGEVTRSGRGQTRPGRGQVQNHKFLAVLKLLRGKQAEAGDTENRQDTGLCPRSRITI